MSRDYFAVFGKLFRTPKFRRLDEQVQLSLFYVWGLAGDQDPEATWADLNALRDHLAIHERNKADAQLLLDEGWLDQLDSGEVIVHDWDEWQLAASTQAKRRYEAHRKAGWRKAKQPGAMGASPANAIGQPSKPGDPTPVQDARIGTDEPGLRGGEIDQKRREPDRERRRPDQRERRTEERRGVRDVSGTNGPTPMTSVEEILTNGVP